MFPFHRLIMAIWISYESLPPTFSSSCASTSYSLHLNFTVLVGPGCDIKIAMGKFNLKELIYGLIKGRRACGLWRRDKLLEKTLWSRGQQGIARLWRCLARVIRRKREQFLKSFRYTRGEFTFYFRRLRPWARIIRHIFCRK